MSKSPYNKSFRLIAVLQAVDMLTINLLMIYYWCFERFIHHYPLFLDHKLSYWLVLNVSYLISINTYYVIAHKHLVRPELIISRVARTVFLHTILSLAFISLFHIPDPPFRTIIVYYIATFTSITIERLLIRKCLKQFRYTGHNRTHVVLIGHNNIMAPLWKVISDPWNGYHLSANLDTPEETLEYLKNHHIDEVYCGVHKEEFPAFKEVIKYCEMNVIHFYIVPDIQTFLKRRTSLFTVGDVSLLTFHYEPLKNPYKRLIKRILDITISGLFVCTIYPFIYVIVAIITKITSPGPVYFRQKRTGINGEEFYCLKFRSMKVNGNSDKLQATKDDPRITRFGHLLRKTNIDELPQFVNVLKGDMSLVGPRPHMLAHTEFYSSQIEEYMVRHYIRPGITGWAQINGSRGETKTVEDMQRRIDLDIWYLENWTFWLDIVIIFRTIINTFRGDQKAY
jgi:Undecaprenyl-phosphate glucose phosphotransferase